jgi:hypothetical protein
MASPKQKTAAAIIGGVLVAVTPSFFGYLQARQEIREKYNANRDKMEAGYDTMVASLKELQQAVVREHDYVVKLEGQVAVLTAIFSIPRPLMTPSASKFTLPAITPALDAMKPINAPTRPDFSASPAFNQLNTP